MYFGLDFIKNRNINVKANIGVVVRFDRWLIKESQVWLIMVNVFRFDIVSERISATVTRQVLNMIKVLLLLSLLPVLWAARCCDCFLFIILLYPWNVFCVAREEKK